MAFAGIRGTGSFGTDERPKSFRETILYLNPNGNSPLTALFDRMRKESVNDPEFSWWDETRKVPRLQVDGSHNSSVTTIAVETAAAAGRFGDVFDFRPGDLLLVEHAPVDGQAFTGTNYERLQVVAVSTVAGQLQVRRGYGGSTAATIPDQAFLTKLGSAHAEGSRSPTSKSRNPTKRYNYCQIFKTPFEITKTAMKTKFRTGDPMQNDKLRGMFDHQTGMEFQFIFGERSELLGSTGNPERQTGGILRFLEDNLKVWATPPSEDDLIDAFSPLFNVTAPLLGNERLAFCGSGFLNCLNKVIKNSPSTTINYNGMLDMYGMKFARYVFPMGEVAFKIHPLFNVHGLYNNSALVIAPMALRYRPLRDTTEEKNIQENDADLIKNQWITEAGIEVNHQEAHGFFHITDTALPA